MSIYGRHFVGDFLQLPQIILLFCAPIIIIRKNGVQGSFTRENVNAALSLSGNSVSSALGEHAVT